MHSKSEIMYVKSSTRGGLVDCHPIGAVSENCAGKDITEMIDMHAAGAVAFSDGKKPVQDSGLMLRALQYVTSFEGVVINQPLDDHIAGDGQMHEGLMSTSLGMKGIPTIAEELMVQRDLELLEYTGSRLHLANLSGAGAVQRLREAKAQGMPVTGSVAVLNLAFDDDSLQNFDTNLKVMPPLRSAEDRAALIEGLKDGTIDIISSNHTPLEEESKKLEFPFAEFGAVTLETTYALLQTTLGEDLSPETLVNCLALRPRQLFRLPAPRLETGQPANLTVFHPGVKWSLRPHDIRSRSRNTPLLGRELTGAVLAVVNNNQSVIFEYP
jgi:dihydroorotase